MDTRQADVCNLIEDNLCSNGWRGASWWRRRGRGQGAPGGWQGKQTCLSSQSFKRLVGALNVFGLCQTDIINQNARLWIWCKSLVVLQLWVQEGLDDGSGEASMGSFVSKPIVSSVRSSSGYHGLIEIRSAAAATHFSKFFKFFRF